MFFLKLSRGWRDEMGHLAVLTHPLGNVNSPSLWIEDGGWWIEIAATLMKGGGDCFCFVKTMFRGTSQRVSEHHPRFPPCASILTNVACSRQ